MSCLWLLPSHWLTTCMEQPRNPLDFQWENRDRLYTGYRIPDTGSARHTHGFPARQRSEPAARTPIFDLLAISLPGGQMEMPVKR